MFDHSAQVSPLVSGGHELVYIKGSLYKHIKVVIFSLLILEITVASACVLKLKTRN
jgi:hypothetical protein